MNKHFRAAKKAVYVGSAIEEKPVIPQNFRDLSEIEQKQLCFEVISRCNHYPDFYGHLLSLMSDFDSPYQSINGVQSLKPEFGGPTLNQSSCNCES